MGWEQLRERFAWPAARPATRPLVHGWTTEAAQWSLLMERIPPDGIVLEVGAWTGKSSLHVLLGWPRARLIAVDIWTESPVALGGYWPTWRSQGQLAAADTPKSLYQANLWECRERVVLVQADSAAGMLAVWATCVAPDLVYVDADHGEGAAYRDIALAVELFPDAVISGHDYTTDAGGADNGVSRAVRRAQPAGFCARGMGKVWWYEREAPPCA